MRLLLALALICMVAEPALPAGPTGAACPIEGEGNCQSINDFSDFHVVPSDLSAPGGPIVRADDFVPLADSLSAVCVWGRYLDTSHPDGDQMYDCADAVTDEFRVTVYTDAGGLPGNVVGTSTVSSVSRDTRPPTGLPDPCGDVWGHEVYAYQLELDDPIAGMVPGECHWLEVANNTASPEGIPTNFCVWRWSTVKMAGNAYSFSGSHNGDRGVYEDGGQRSMDLAFCLDVDFEPGGCGILERACCTCPDNGSTCSVETFQACSNFPWGHWDLNAFDCTQATCPTGGPLGDDCLTDAIPITGDTSINFNTACANTDGPTCFEFGCSKLGSDIWFAYTATCTGHLVASMCATGNQYDSMIALYHDQDNPQECVCPDPTLADRPSAVRDENCTGCVTGGAGVVIQVVRPGECWLIRVGGYGFGAGPGQLDVACEEETCRESSPPRPQVLLDTSGSPVVSVKNRYLSFEAGDPGEQQAVQVTFFDLPSPYDTWNGTAMWVGEPRETSENGSTPDPIPGHPTFKAATLRCDPFFTDLSAQGMVHVFHEGIIPNAVYGLRVVEKRCYDLAVPVYSTPIGLSTASWGDTIGDCDVIPCTPSDGSVHIVDVMAVVARFSTADNAIVKARADLEPETPDQVINITDVLRGVGAFVGLAYPFAPTTAAPCNIGRR